MSTFRIITKHVRYWRGEIHRWTNSYAFTGSGTTVSVANLGTLVTNESPLLYHAAGTVAGGCWGAAAYHTGGGVPVAEATYFDPDTPSSWAAYTSTGWGSTFTAPLEAAAEVSLALEWPAGISASGKPVFFRKWYHAVPSSNPASPGAVDIASGVVTSLTTAATNLTNCLAASSLVMGNAGRFAGSPVIKPYYQNHQMPRGRRRKALVTADGRYTGPTISGGTGLIPIEAD